jgi:hypothetical protein
MGSAKYKRYYMTHGGAFTIIRELSFLNWNGHREG